MTNAPTYTLRPSGAAPGEYLCAVSRLADEVLAAGEELRPVVDAYGTFVEETGREPRRSHAEYLLEALALGVLWRARGEEAVRMGGARRRLMELLAGGRRAGGDKVRDGSACLLLSLDMPHEPGRPDPSLADVERLLTWLLASGEYDDEVARLEGWEAFLRAAPSTAEETLEELVAFAIAFGAWGEHALGRFTSGVDRFLLTTLPEHRWREDTVQCARRRTEYHLNMLGAEILNRAWRADFLACRRHVVVVPACMRRQPAPRQAQGDRPCVALQTSTELRCTHCTAGCAVSAATRVAERAGGEAIVVVHGSDFSRFLRSPPLSGGEVGIVGVACVPGLLGAGWRARAKGLPAQCVLLEASGCEHWRDVPVPTALDLRELGRILVAPAFGLQAA